MTLPLSCRVRPGGVTLAQVRPPLTVRARPWGAPLRSWVQAHAVSAPAGQTWRSVWPAATRAGREIAGAGGEVATVRATTDTAPFAPAAGGLAAQAATATSAPQAAAVRDSGRRTGMLGMPPP